MLRLASAAYLARYKGTPRIPAASGLRIYFGWCAKHGLDPLASPASRRGCAAVCGP
ncbi:MAG TPA: hypothetical protein VLW50_11560 [Streptosporangiaceae bacterium]|nr:hypothetical protein [Streptosporangiaceae bacterium]